MKIITSIQEMQALCQNVYRQNRTIGFVPTMGFLHEGHLTLMEQARRENDLAVASIFVNPLQFGPNEDFDRYPRDIARDEALAAATGIDYLFYPSVADMYGAGLNTQLTAIRRVDALCGSKRPGHFDGVCTVLLKLFNIVTPDRVYMGLKDAQQVAVVQGLVEDYNIPTQIIGVPTVREADGLAKSSRNVYLTPAERQLAPLIFKTLQEAKAKVLAGEDDAKTITRYVGSVLQEANTDVDYVELRSYPALDPIEKISSQAILAVAVKFSKARLIDNIILKGEV